MIRFTVLYKYMLSLLLCTTVLASCTKNFDELNTHPFNPTEGDLTNSEQLGTLFPTLISTMHYAQENKSQMIEQMVGGQYGGYFATTNNWQGTNFGTLNPALDWVGVTFSDIMVDFNSNYLKIKNVTQSRGYIYAWANIIRVAAMLRVVDTYGPIPYSKIGTTNDDHVPFDDVQTVYHTMFSELDESLKTLADFVQEAGSPTDNPMSTFDALYGGDFNKWMKFANALKMRMAIRISAVDADFAKEKFQEALASGAIEDNADNALLPTEDNPYYKASADWEDLAISATLSSYMSGFADPRISKYMTQAAWGSTYRGVRTGIQNINKNNYGKATYFSKPAFNAATPLLVFCAAETNFLKAEAALKGWIAGGDAQAKAFYENGVRLSMTQHQVDEGDYLIGTSSPAAYTDIFSTRNNITVPKKITVSWDDAGSSENSKLEKIITQKWLANFPYGMEAWADYRRTGYPQIFPAADNLSSSGFIGSINNSFGRLVRRLPYPQAQYRNNNAFVSEAVGMLGGADAGSTDLWWAKKN